MFKQLGGYRPYLRFFFNEEQERIAVLSSCLTKLSKLSDTPTLRSPQTLDPTVPTYIFLQLNEILEFKKQL